MAKYNVLVRFTGYTEIEVEADSTAEAHEEAWAQAEPEMVDHWDVDIECADEEEGEEEW